MTQLLIQLIKVKISINVTFATAHLRNNLADLRHGLLLRQVQELVELQNIFFNGKVVLSYNMILAVTNAK